MSEEPRVIDASMLDTRVEFERGMSGFAPLALTLTAAHLAVFALMLAFGALREPELLLAAGARKTSLVLSGQWWRLLSSVFMHGSVAHLASNTAALYVVGLGCEHAFGRRLTFAAFVATGIAGSLAGCLRETVTVGASGAIFGLLGLLAASLYLHRERLSLRDRRTAGVLLLWAAYSILQGVFDPQVDNFAHAGGFAAGAALGRWVVPSMLREGPYPAETPAALAALGAVAYTALTAFSTFVR